MPHRHGRGRPEAVDSVSTMATNASHPSPVPAPNQSLSSPYPSLSPSLAPAPSFAPTSPAIASASLQPNSGTERRRSSSSFLVHKLSHSHSAPLQGKHHHHRGHHDQQQQQQQALLTTTPETPATTATTTTPKKSIATMLFSFAKKMKLSDKDKDKDKSSKDKNHPPPLARSASNDKDSFFQHDTTSLPAHDGANDDGFSRLPEIDLALLPMPAAAAAGDPGPPPPMATFDAPPPLHQVQDMHDDDDQDLEFESTLDINISTLTSSLSAALSHLSAFTQPLVCDRDLDLPDECRLASTLAAHLVTTYLPSKQLPHFTLPTSEHDHSTLIRPKDAATYLTSILARHFLTKLAQSMPQHASDAATRRAAREVTYHFLRADAMGAMHVPLPPFWAGVIADLCEWVESTLAEQFAFSDSLYTEADRERVQHAARACALATAMMRVVHPQLSYAWVRPGVRVNSDEVRGPVEEWVGERPTSSGSHGVRVAYCVFPKVDESETGLEEVGIWKAVVVGYVESDPTSQQQPQQQHPGPQKAPVPQPMMVAQGLPPRFSSKAPTPSNVPVEQHVSRSLPIAHVVAQQQLAQPPAPSARLDSRALSVPTTFQQQQQQQQHHVVPAVVVHHQPTDALPAYFTLDHPAPISTTTSTTPIAPLDDHDDTDESAPANPLSLDYPDDDSDSDEQGVRARDQAMVMSALHQDYVVQTSLDAASAAAAAAAAAVDGNAGVGDQVFEEFGAMQSR